MKPRFVASAGRLARTRYPDERPVEASVKFQINAPAGVVVGRD